MAASEWITDNGLGSLGELAAVRLLCSALARVFSYPSVDQAKMLTNGESLEYVFGLLDRASLVDYEAYGFFESAKLDTEDTPEARARLMRRVFTQLFYRPGAPIPLEGRFWIRRDPAELAKELGEEASVRQSYKAVGVRVKSEVVERACALSTELDFVAYLLGREIDCSREGSGAQALVWKRRRLEFSERHLLRFGCAVADEISQNTSWNTLLFWTAALQRIVRRCVL